MAVENSSVTANLTISTAKTVYDVSSDAIPAAISSTGLVLNILFLIWLHLKRAIPRTVPRMLITNLCVSDSLACVIDVATHLSNVVTSSYFIVPADWFGSVLCRLFYRFYLYWAVSHASINNITLLSVERYLSVAHRHIHRRSVTTKRIVFSVVLCWMTGAAATFFSVLRADRNGDHCVSANFSAQMMRIRVITLFFTSFIIPYSITFFCNIGIICVLRKQQRFHRSHNSTKDHQRVIFWFITTSSMAFLCLLGPGTLFNFLFYNFLDGLIDPKPFTYSTGLLHDIHYVVNPIFYFATLSHLCHRYCVSSPVRYHVPTERHVPMMVFAINELFFYVPPDVNRTSLSTEPTRTGVPNLRPPMK